MSISPARTAAFDILLRIERERAFSSVLLALYAPRVSPADRALCHEIVLGTLRRQIKLDRMISALAAGRKLDSEVRLALRLALFQVLSLDKVPHRAAINDSVELVKRARKASASGFVNAILRRAARELPELEYTDELDRISVETSHPRWLLEKWATLIGMDSTADLAESNNQAPRLAFRVIGPITPDVDRLIGASEPSSSVSACYLLDRYTPLVRQLADEGRIYIQDEASQMVAHAVKLSPGGSFLDVCAAPGGKTGLVAALNGPVRVTAGDLHPSRVRLLRENCQKQGVDAAVLRYDAAASLPFEPGSFDAVLVDAPCTGTGTIRHNPEIRYFLNPGDVAELSAKQRRILAEASKAVRKGGSLVYSTCSLEPEEGEQIVSEFLSDDPSFRNARPDVPEAFLTGEGHARTWPQRDGMDGFFIASFVKV